jgi:uncharacterized protein YqfB (UPF0267 family)
MFDLDYYSSTMDAFEIFKKPHLPRVFCYFDDVVGNEISLYNEFTGELLAINEFNAQHENMKIAKCREVVKVTRDQERIFAMHDFEHPKYATYVNDDDGHYCDLDVAARR